MARRPLGAVMGNGQRSCLLSAGTPCMGHGDGGVVPPTAGKARGQARVADARTRGLEATG